jgi:glycosyltransferase involved in cell wall biosynthesis
MGKIIISGLDSGGYGGSEVFLQNLSEELRKRSVKTEFLAVDYIDFYKYLKQKGEKVTGFKFRLDFAGDFKGFLKSLIILPYAVFKYYQVIAVLGSNAVVILTGTTDKIVLTPVCRLHNIPVYWLEYAPIIALLNKFGGVPKYFYQSFSRSVEKIIVPTVYAKNIWIKNGVFPKDKLTVVPLGRKIITLNENKRRVIREKVRSKLKIGDSLVVGMISRFEKDKGQDRIIEIAKLTKDINIKYLIAGVGENFDLIKKEIQLNDLNKSVKLLGFYPESKKWELYSAFDLFLFPTRWKYEGWGLVLLEAMMSGIPIVTSNFGPVPEVVGNAAIMVKDRAENYRKAILQLAANNTLYQYYRELGFKRVGELSIERTADLFLSVIHSQ